MRQGSTIPTPMFMSLKYDPFEQTCFNANDKS